jgi:hypothetical protein
MLLRLNRTTQADPTCTGQAESSVTTFLAGVEAYASRLQALTTGTAYGSWNCHGMNATVQLDDGTTYELLRDYQPGQPGASWSVQPPGTWSSGLRSGRFRFTELRHAPQGTRESHFDVLVHNRTGRDWDIVLGRPTSVAEPLAIQYSPPFMTGNVAISPPFGSISIDATGVAWEHVPAAGSANLSWPSHTYRRATLSNADRDLERYVIVINPTGDSRVLDPPNLTTCLLAPDHADRLELIIDNGQVQCGDGWVGSSYVAATRSRLYINAGAGPLQDTVTIIHEGWPDHFFYYSVDPPEPTIGHSARLVDPVHTLLTVSATQQTPRSIFTIEQRGFYRNQLIQEFSLTVTIHVYELRVTVPDTVTVAAGTSGTADIELHRVGFLGNDVLLRIAGLPAGVSALFDPAVASSAMTWLDISVDNNVAPGTYDLEICAIMLEDPAQPCTFAPLALVVTDPIPPGSIAGRVFVTGLNLSGVRVELHRAGQLIAARTTDFNGTYAFVDVPPGDYTLTISGYPGYATFSPPSRNVTVVSGQELIVDFAGTYSGQ